MKKFFGLISILVLSLFLISCDTTDEGGLKVGLISSAAGLNDKGYNQFAVEGLDQAVADFGVKANKVDITDASQISETLARFGREKYDLVFTLEYDFNDLIVSHSGGAPIAEKYPNTTFVIFNEFANTDKDGKAIHDNVIEVLFNVNESSFLAGALSVLVNENKTVLFGDNYSFSDDRALAFMGGTESNGITVFSYGFMQGANHVAAELDVTYKMYETYQAGFAASTENANRAKGYYQAGVNVIFGVAGPVAGNIRNEAEAAKRLMIDVDANQDSEKPGRVLTSVLKKTNVIVYELVEDLVKERLEGGATKYYSLASESTDITDLSVIKGFIEKTEAATAKWNEIVAKLDDLAQKINNGTIEVVDAQKGDVLDRTTLTNMIFPS